MATIIIEVMPKAELLDPAGKAVARALAREGLTRFDTVRIGKRFELTVSGEVTNEDMDTAKQIAQSLLSNGVIEEVVSIRVDSAD